LEGEDKTRDALTMLLNHFEFLAAGLRNGDISEQLLKDSERSTFVGLVEASEAFIHKVRDRRQRRSVFEHIEWLYDRWHASPPTWWQSVVEAAIDRPLYRNHNRWYWLVGATAALAIVIGWIHIPPTPHNAPASPPQISN
jgi:hypothetical protein